MTLKGSDPSLLRRMNAIEVLRELRASEPLTAAQLARAIGLARSTVEEALTVLSSEALVEALAPTPGRGRSGRPARRYRFRSEAGYVAGIGVDQIRVTVTLCDLAGSVVARHAQLLPDRPDDTNPAEQIQAAVTAAMNAHQLPRRLLMSAGAGVPGIVSPQGEILRCDPAPSWAGLDLTTALRRRLGCHTIVENHGRMAVSAECWRGAAQDSDHVLFVLGGIRIGFGMTTNGQILHGRHGAAGEIGHLPMFNGDVTARHRAMLGSALPDLSVEEAAEVALSSPEDPDLAAFRQQYVDDVARIINALVLAVDPEVVVLGGALGTADEHLVTALRDQITGTALFAPTIVRTALGDDAISLGGAQRALDQIEQTMLNPADLAPPNR